jgi:hypothetical protein
MAFEPRKPPAECITRTSFFTFCSTSGAIWERMLRTSCWRVLLLGEAAPVEERVRSRVGKECGEEERVVERWAKTVGPSQRPGMKTMVGLGAAIVDFLLMDFSTWR